MLGHQFSHGRYLFSRSRNPTFFVMGEDGIDLAPHLFFKRIREARLGRGRMED